MPTQKKFAAFRMSTLILLMTPIALSAQTTSVDELLFEPIDQKRERTIPIKVFVSSTDGPQPIILFSHGLGGSRHNNSYLGKYWASKGFVAVFMQHRGSDEDIWKSAKRGKRMAALKSATGVQSSLQRFNDVPFVIDQLEHWAKKKGHKLFGKLDLKNIGMSGHSFGAVTTLAVAGRKYPFNRNFADMRIDAFLAMSPSLGKGIGAKEAFGHLTKPVLCMTGTKDRNPIDPTAKPSSRREVYHAMPNGNKFMLVLDGGEHFAFGDGQRRKNRNPKHHPAIQEISLRFWNAYLKHDAKSKEWLNSKMPISVTGLGNADVWKHK